MVKLNAQLKAPPNSKESEVTPTSEEVVNEESTQLEYNHDTEANTVSFSLSNGTEITVREPKAIDFLRVKGWRDMAPPDDQSAQMSGYKLVSLCIVRFKRPNEKEINKPISVYDLLDSLECREDLQMAANCLDFFRDSIERIAGQSDGL